LDGVIFREANQHDADEIAYVYLASRRHFLPYAKIPYTDAQLRIWIAETVIPKSNTIVAVKDEQIIGMMSMKNGDTLSWIDHLYIHPEFVNDGLGSRFIEKALTALKPPIRLVTFQENEGARRFYERHGFIAIDYNDGSRNEEGCPDVIFEWQT